MKITICDDEPKHLALISGYVAEYIHKENLDIRIKKFADPQTLLADEKQNGGSSIYILDIIMDGMSGLELGRNIREYNKRAVIIYLTTTKDFSLDAFSVHAFSYLLKPINRDNLFDELNKCFTYCLPSKKEEPVITVKTAEGLLPLRLRTINAVEYFDHRLVYHLTDNSQIAALSARERFDKQAENILALNVFIKCADSYLVNMQNILSVTARGFKMKNGAEFTITRKYSASKDTFLKYKFRESETN